MNISAWQYFVKWAMLILLVMVIARTAVGYKIVYYFLWLTVLLLAVTHPQDIANVLNPQPASGS